MARRIILKKTRKNNKKRIKSKKRTYPPEIQEKLQTMEYLPNGERNPYYRKPKLSYANAVNPQGKHIGGNTGSVQGPSVDLSNQVTSILNVVNELRNSKNKPVTDNDFTNIVNKVINGKMISADEQRQVLEYNKDLAKNTLYQEYKRIENEIAKYKKEKEYLESESHKAEKINESTINIAKEKNKQKQRKLEKARELDDIRTKSYVMSKMTEVLNIRPEDIPAALEKYKSELDQLNSKKHRTAEENARRSELKEIIEYLEQKQADLSELPTIEYDIEKTKVDIDDYDKKIKYNMDMYKKAKEMHHNLDILNHELEGLKSHVNDPNFKTTLNSNIEEVQRLRQDTIAKENEIKRYIDIETAYYKAEAEKNKLTDELDIKTKTAEKLAETIDIEGARKDIADFEYEINIAKINGSEADSDIAYLKHLNDKKTNLKHEKSDLTAKLNANVDYIKNDIIEAEKQCNELTNDVYALKSAKDTVDRLRNAKAAYEDITFQHADMLNAISTYQNENDPTKLLGLHKNVIAYKTRYDKQMKLHDEINTLHNMSFIDNMKVNDENARYYNYVDNFRANFYNDLSANDKNLTQRILRENNLSRLISPSYNADQESVDEIKEITQTVANNFGKFYKPEAYGVNVTPT